MNTSTFSTTKSDRRKRYEALLGSWCNSLLDLQVTGSSASLRGLNGGILCPACARLHGRSADAVYHFLYQARALQSDRFRVAAVDLLNWSRRVSTPDGAFKNEPTGNRWKGITVFSLLSLGEALRHHGDLLDEATAQQWRDRLRQGSDFLMGYIEDLWKSNINYPFSCAAALAVAAAVLGEDIYRQRALDLLHECLPYFRTENHLIFGEGKPMDGITPRGCRAVDLGYNVEESIPNIALCARLLGDAEAESIAVQSLQSHLEFLLPDGAWDNSWGARSFKWTYWGSRTSDGCQFALALLAEADERFLPAADRNLGLLEICTRDGMLYGGPHLAGHGDLPCIHHTFCHAKALAAALDTPALQAEADDSPRSLVSVSLPREAGSVPVRLFPEIATGLIAHGAWRATVTAYDWKYAVGEEHPSGGALSLLWHSAAGPLFAASMTTYREIEPSNAQPWHATEPPFCLTPQLLLEQEGRVLRSISDTRAEADYVTNAEGVIVTVRGHLTDGKHESIELLVPFELKYSMGENGFDISAVIIAEWSKDDRTVILQLPFIAASTETVVMETDRHLMIQKSQAQLSVEANIALLAPDPPSMRYFNPIPGFEAYVVKLPVPSGHETKVRLRVS
ncbi:MAG: hypothetical protein V4671_17365 [Armatimonadota bacterium]